MSERSMSTSRDYDCEGEHIMSQFPAHSRMARLAQAGFSLIELLVAMAIGLLIMVAVLQLYLDIMRNNDEMAKTNVQIENGRFAMQLISTDLVHAGFWGGFTPHFADVSAVDLDPDYPANFIIPDACKAFAAWTAADKDNVLRFPIQVYDAVPPGCSGIVLDKKANTDVLVVRHAGTCEVGATNCEADTVNFQFSRCETELETAPYGYVLNGAGFTKKRKDCGANTAGVRRYIAHIYYIRTYSEVGDGIPTLMRAEFKSGVMQPAQPLIEGIEAFAVSLGIDDQGGAVDYAVAPTAANRGDGAADGVLKRCTTAAPCSESDLINAVTVRLDILVRNKDATIGYIDDKIYTVGGVSLPAFDDGFKRHLYSSTTSLINVTSRRESL